MNPQALLLFYEPNHRYKHRKYLIGIGNNFIGSDPNSQIYIDDKSLPPQSATIRLRNDMLTLMRMDDMVNVVVESNLIPRKKICLDKNIEYVLIPEKQFQIGRWKGLFKIVNQEQARALKGVVNKHMFSWDADTKKQDIDVQDIGNSMIDQIPNPSNNPQMLATLANPSQTLYLPDGDIGPTLILPDNDDSDKTEKLQESDRQDEMPETLQQKSQQSQRKSKNNNSSFQLPKTLVQDQMPATLQQSSSKHKQSKVTTRTTTSVYISNNQKQKGNKLQDVISHTFPQNITVNLNKTISNVRKTQSYEDILFGLVPTKPINQNQSMVQQQHPNSLIRSGKPLLSVNLFQEQSLRNKQEQIKPQDKNTKVFKKVIFTGFKLTADQRNRLTKLNMKIIENSEEQYDTLIISRQCPKITKRLLQALISRKQIISDGMLINGNGEITQTFLGMPWKDIISKQNRIQLFKNKKVFLCQSLHTYKQIIEMTGGTVIQSLSKTKGHIMLFLSPQDIDLYKNYKNNKTKTFYNEAILQKSILSNSLPEQQIQQNFFE